jgi:phage replication initiation protein
MGSVQRAEQTPSVIRGESPTGEVLIDTVSVTMPVRAVEAIVGTVCGWTQSNEQIIAAMQKFLNFLFGEKVFVVPDKLKGGRNFFDHSLPFDNGAGFIAWGGNNKVMSREGDEVREVEPRLQIYVSGDGCCRVPDWSRVSKKLEKCEARITRVDVAFDSHDGAFTVDDCIRWYREGLFTGQGRPPKAKYIDDFGSKEGRTFYVGKRENGKMFRGYEKGKQLGDPESPWVRFECEIHANDRTIPLDILSSPAAYLAGSYRALNFISGVIERIKTARLKLDIQFAKLMRIARTQYGKLLHFANRWVGLSEDQIFIDLCNVEGFPDRLKWVVKSQFEDYKSCITLAA